MKYRVLYLLAAAGFLAGTVVELRPPRNVMAAVLDAVAGAIFLFLGALGQNKTKS